MTAVPDRRLSFVTPSDQAQFGQLFTSGLQPGETAMNGDTARVVLMRSQLPTNVLGDIWQLADTTRSGTLMFPEFCLAMSLCAAARRGEPVPRELHPGLLKEIGDMVDQISFGVPDTQPNDFDRLQATQQTGFGAQGYQSYQQPVATGYQGYQQPLQPQATSYGYSGLQAQPTGGYSAPQPQTSGGYGLQPQATGGYGLQPQTTGGYGLRPQTTGGYGVQPQTTGSYGLQPQTTGGYGLQPQTTGGYGLQPQTTGGYSSVQPQTTGGYGLQPQTTGGYSGVQPQTTGGYSQPLQSQATGYMQTQATGYVPLTSQPTGKPGEWGFTNSATPGIENFVGVFNGTNSAPPAAPSGSVETAISKVEKSKYDEIFSQWSHGTGFVDGGAAIENFGKSGLPQQDLGQIWALSDSTDRGRLNRDEFAVAMHLIYRRISGYPIPSTLPPELLPPSSRHLQDSLNQVKAFLKQPSATKSKSFSSAPKKDATVFKNNDNSETYVSANRRKAPAAAAKSQKGESLSELAKAVKEKKILLDALDAEGEDDATEREIEAKNKRAIEDLKREIKQVHAEVEAKSPKPASGGAPVNKHALLKKLEGLTDTLPQLTMSIRKVEQDIAIARVELARKQYEKTHPGVSIAGTGPNGEVTEADRAAAQRKAELRARMSAITGRPLENANAFEEFEQVLQEATSKAAQEREANEQSLKALEESTRSVQRDLDGQLRGAGSEQEDRDRRRWVDAIGVDPEVKQFIASLNPSAPRADAASAPSTPAAGASPSAPAANAAGAAPKETAAERVARIRAEAQRRTQERFAKAGIQMRKRGEDREPEPKVEPKELKPEPKPEPQPEPKVEPKPVTVPVSTSKPAQAPKAAPAFKPGPQVEEPESESDGETARLEAEMAAMQLRHKEREAASAARKKEKAEKLAALRKQQEELKKKEASWSDDDSEPESQAEALKNTNPFGKKTTPDAAPQAKPPQFQPVSSSKPAQAPAQPAQPKTPVAPASVAPASTAPAPTARAPVPTAAPLAKSNPFGPRPTTDDDWGSDADESDEDGPGHSNAAQLASMLFGTMGGAQRAETPEPPKASASVPQPKSVPNGASQAVERSVPAPETSEPTAEPFAAPPAPPAAPPAPPAAPPAPPAAPPAPPAAPTMPAEMTHTSTFHHSNDDEFASAEEDFDFISKEPSSIPPAPPSEPVGAPPAPPFSEPETPPAPPSAPPAPPSAPPAPPSAPPAPPSAPPAPPSAPPAPPSAPPAPPSAPPAPPSAPPAPPAASVSETVAAPAGPPGFAALLGDITKGASLRKVDSSQQRIAQNDQGRVL